MKVLLVGVSGQIGGELYKVLQTSGFDVVGLARGESTRKHFSAKILRADLERLSLEQFQDLHFDAAIHLADTTYFSTKGKSTVDCFRSNLKKARKFLSLCRATKVKKIIYVSSSGVYGENAPIRHADECAPMLGKGWYQRSKIAVERIIRRGCAKYEMSYVIVRPPLVYSEYAKGKFKWLLEAVYRKVPLPIVGKEAKRSMISTYHLCNFLCHCLKSVSADNQVFNVADRLSWTYPDLVNEVAAAMNMRPRLFSVPSVFIRAFGCIKWSRRVLDSLERPHILNISKAETLLGWDFSSQGGSRVDEAAKRYAIIKKDCDDSDTH